MVDKRNTTLWLLVILAVGFIYRFALTTFNVFPPGADIGLHQSVIDSIMSPKTTFLYNYYHMGGGLSATNPGYHIFSAFIISMTGATDYLVQASVSSLFSALIIMAAFMVVRLVWGQKAAFVVAILVTFSASDIIMLSWAGYPNIVALALIPLMFYLFLQPAKITQKNYLVVTSIIASALFLTHLFSAIVFLAITLFALLISSVFSKSTGLTKRNALYWLIPIFFGFIITSPYLLSVIPIYFGTEGAITGGVGVMKQAVVETRVISTVTMSLAVVPIVMFLVFSKRQNSKVFTLPSVLFASAILVPLAAAQCYLFGFFLDYERFLYFLALPVIVCIGLIVVKASEILPIGLAKIRVKVSPVKAKPVLLSVLVIACLLTPLFVLPYNPVATYGFDQANYFQVMNPTKYQAIQWIKDNTPADSVIVSDAELGWWISGFAQRPTLSSVDPQYLILKREFQLALIAANFLEADYSADNGILQIQQPGAYANGSTHDIYAVLNSSIIKPLVFALNDTQISLLYRDAGAPKETKLGAFTDSSTQVANDSTSTSFIIARENELFRVTEEITIFQGLRFAKVTFVFQSLGEVNFDWLHIPFKSRGELIEYANSIGVVDNTLHMVNQIVLPENKLGGDVNLQQNPDNYELICKLNGNSTAVMSFFVGLCPFDADSFSQTESYNSLIEVNANTYLNVVSDQPVTCFDYKTALREWNISYIVVRDASAIARFAEDSTFKVVFQNNEVTIFEVARI